MFEEFQEKTQLALADVDYIIPHQASRALPLVMEKLGVAEDLRISTSISSLTMEIWCQSLYRLAWLILWSMDLSRREMSSTLWGLLLV